MATAIGKILTSPKMIVVGMLLGIICGIYVKPLIPYLTPIGESYKSLLVMCVVPIIFTSIVLSLANMFKSHTTTKKLSKLAITFVVCTLLTAIFAALIILLIKNQLGLGLKAQNVLAETIATTEVYPPTTPEITPYISKFAYFLQNIIPYNIFTALTEGLTSKIILVALLIGVALGKIKGKKGENFMAFFTVTNELFHKIFRWILTLAPIGLLGIFASSTDSFDTVMLQALLRLIIVIYIIGIILIALYYSIIRYQLKISFLDLIRLLKKPLLLACATMNSIVAIPYSIKCLSTISLEKQMVELTIPLGITINRQGNILLFTTIAMFSLVFYNIPPTFANVTTIILMSALLGFSTFGGAIVSVPIFSVIASMVGIPTVMGTTIIIAAELFIIWIMILVTLFANYAITILLAQKKNTSRHKRHIAKGVI